MVTAATGTDTVRITHHPSPSPSLPTCGSLAHRLCSVRPVSSKSVLSCFPLFPGKAFMATSVCGVGLNENVLSESMNIYQVKKESTI